MAKIIDGKKISAEIKEELKTEANKWELSHGGISGRTAQQFINYLQGISSTEEK